MQATTLRRWTSEGGTPRRIPLRPSREGSVPASSLEVRCACQFFQSDNLLPDKNLIIRGTPVPRPIVNVFTQSDHEYEPVGKPVSVAEIALESVDLQRHEPDSTSTPDILPETPPPPVLQVSTEDFHSPKEDDASSTTSHERQFLRPSTDEDHPHYDSYDGQTPDQQKTSAVLQKQMEDRYFRDTPTTPESKTDCEISTSQVDSSALENLPLKKENRKRSSMSAEASKLQQRIKTQTGKMKTKLKSIKKPQFNMPERPKFERPKFNMPERPKFNLPERPKINLPERPKFNLPERPKFNMPERPKFNLPERPKFNMPERPKINFPERPKFSLPDKSKFKLPNRPKFNFPERPKFNFSDKAKFTMPDRSKFKLPDRPKIFSAFGKNKESEPQESEFTGETSSTPKKKILDFDFRTYPRFSKFRKDKKEGKTERPGTPPPTFYTFPHAKKDRKAVMGAAHWEDPTNRSTEEEPRNYGPPKSYPSDSDLDFESKLARVDKDYNEMQEEYKYEKQDIAKAKLENAEIWNAMEKNSVQRLEHRASLPCEWPMGENEEMDNAMAVINDDQLSVASLDNHRRGVLEEINNDEFFLRQKGISQDNIEVGKYLTDEIRDAFRSPVNALSQMNGRSESSRIPKYIEVVNIDNDDFKQSDDYIEINEDQDHDMIEHDDGYYTFPPVRPSRSRKTKHEIQRVEIPKEIITCGFAEEEPVALPPKFKEVPKKQENEKEELHKKSKFSSAFKDTEVLDNLNEYENEIDQTKEMPLAPKRRKRSNSRKDVNCSEDGSLFNGSYEAERWAAIKNISDKPSDDEIVVYRMEYVVPAADSELLPEESPLPPRRSRTRSRGSRTASVCDDDRTSRGAESLTLDSHIINTEFSDLIDDVETYPGYAVVEKVSTPKKPEPPPRPSAPVRRHRSTKSLSGDRQYFTVPRALNDTSPPRRPLRNYSTLGPSRPPRKKSSTTSLNNLQPSITQSASNLDTTQYVEIDDELEAHKDLKSGEVLSKMKYRPLPPPPRPPRGPKKKKDSDDKQDLDEDGEGNFIIDANFDEFKMQGSHDAEIDIERLISRPSESIPNEVDLSEIIFDADINVSVQNEFETVEPDIEKQVIEVDLPVGILNERSAYIDYDNDEIVEIEVSTQTDPLPDDFDYTIGMDEPFPEIKDMQIDMEESEENSIEAEIFTKSLQRFRESSRPSSRSSRPRTPVELKGTDRPKTPLDRSMSPTAILVERRVSSPTRINEHDVMVTEASLTVIPIEEPEQKTKPIQAETVVKHSPIWEAFNAHSPIETIMESEPIPPPRKISIIEERSRINNENTKKTETTQPLNLNSNMEVLRTQKLQVSDLEVERLNVGELSASKILVSEIEGLSLQVTDINSKSGNIVVRGIEIAPGMIDELLQRFANMAPPSSQASTQTPAENMQAEAQTEVPSEKPAPETETIEKSEKVEEVEYCPGSPPIMVSDPEVQEIECQLGAHGEGAPERPPPPNIPFNVPYYTGYPEPPPFYRFRPNVERSHGDFSPDSRSHEGETSRPRRRRARREPLSSSDDDEARPASRRQATRTAEPSIQDLSSQLLRACQNSMGRTLHYILQSISSNFGGENKKDMQMALVIVLVMIAGLILLGVGDGRTVHHHHWDFYNPPSNEK